MSETKIEMGFGDSFVFETVQGKVSDPFDGDLTKIRGLDGLDSGTKRKATNAINKYYEGKDAKSMQIQDESKFNTMFSNGYGFFDVAKPEYDLGYLAEVYKISAPHYAAVQAKVFNIVGLGYEWTLTTKSEEILQDLTDKQNEDDLEKARRKIARYKESISEWLESLHQEDTFTETMIKVWTDLEATGNGYIEVGRDGRGQVGYLGHIPSHTMRVRRQRDGFVQIIGQNVQFFRHYDDDDTQNPLGGGESNEIIHLKKYSPTDSYYGIPDIIAARNALGGNEFAARYNLDYFEHKAMPKFMVILKNATMDDDVEERLYSFFSGVKGKHQRTVVVPLPTGSNKDQQPELKIEEIGAQMQDASFGKYYEMNRDEILMVHRVPISKISLAKGVNLALGRDADKTFKEQVCRPAQRILEKKINKIIAGVTDALRFKFTEMTLTDEETVSKIYERWLRWGVVVPNEVRSNVLGWRGREGGDEPVDSVTLAKAKGETKQDSEQVTNSYGTRTRDQERSANASDSGDGSRNAKGSGRAVG